MNVLPEDLILPPTRIESGQKEEYTTDLPVTIGTTGYLLRIVVHPMIQDSRTETQLLNLRLELQCPNPDSQKGRIAHAGSNFVKRKTFPDRYARDSDLHRSWHNYERMVNPLFRKRGLMTYLLQMTEEVARRYLRLGLTAEHLELETVLSSVARLVISQRFLQENGLERHGRQDGIDLGFLPHPLDVDAVPGLLDAGTCDLMDEVKARLPVRFFKPLP